MNSKNSQEPVKHHKLIVKQYYSTEYVINGGWEKDYFSDWLDRISADCGYPTLDDIIAECKFANRQIALYLDVVEEQKEKSRINAISV